MARRCLARRDASGFLESGDDCAQPDWEPRLMANALVGGRAGSAGRAIEIFELRLDPGLEVVLAHVGADGLYALPAILRRQLERHVERLRLAGDVEGVDADSPFADLLEGARVLRQD